MFTDICYILFYVHACLQLIDNCEYVKHNGTVTSTSGQA